MRIGFWGTRGSLPVATEAAAIRDKIERVLLKAGAANSPATRRSTASPLHWDRLRANIGFVPKKLAAA